MEKKMLSSGIHNSWGHDPHSDEVPKLNLSQGYMRGNSWHVGCWRAMVEEEGTYSVVFLRVKRRKCSE